MIMKKILPIILVCLLTASFNISFAQHHTISSENIVFDIAEIDRLEERMYLVGQLYHSDYFSLELGERKGEFLITTNENYRDNYNSSFESFRNKISVEFNNFSKEDVANTFNKYQSELPENLVDNIVVENVSQTRDETNSNSTIENALPFCSDTEGYEFPAGTGGTYGEGGPDYGCLGTDIQNRRNPAWYYMRIDSPGGLTIKIYTSPSKDIDFCCWGPFDDPEAILPTDLTADKIVSCSFSLKATEKCVIPSTAQSGEYYILVIISSTNNECNVLFNKIEGEGTTDCDIMHSAIETNSPLCVGETLQLKVQQVENATYFWEGPDGWTSNLITPTRDNVTLAMAGDYTCTITNSEGSIVKSTTIEIFESN